MICAVRVASRCGRRFCCGSNSVVE